MNLAQKYEGLAAELQSLRQDFQGLTVRLGSAAAAQKAVDDVGARLIALEHSSGIADARHLLAHETVTDDLPIFEAEVKLHAQRLEAAKKAVATLLRVRNDADARRKKFSQEVLKIACEVSPISPYERENFERHYLNTRAERASNSIFEKILKPLEPATA